LPPAKPKRVCRKRSPWRHPQQGNNKPHRRRHRDQSRDISSEALTRRRYPQRRPQEGNSTLRHHRRCVQNAKLSLGKTFTHARDQTTLYPRARPSTRDLGDFRERIFETFGVLVFYEQRVDHHHVAFGVVILICTLLGETLTDSIYCFNLDVLFLLFVSIQLKSDLYFIILFNSNYFPPYREFHAHHVPTPLLFSFAI
jgi:hypothetical protein